MEPQTEKATVATERETGAVGLEGRREGEGAVGRKMRVEEGLATVCFCKDGFTGTPVQLLTEILSL